MHNYILAGTATALTSISHIGETRGINALLRREKVLQPNGAVEEVPIISGNGVRGLLRDLGMWHMCHILGYGVNEVTGEVNGLSLPAFYFLFSGGALSGDSVRGLDIGAARRMRSLIPLVGVFGGAMGNQIMEGKLIVGKWIPICQETTHLLPAQFTLRPEQSIWSMLQREAYTRKDDEKNERLRMLVAPETRALLEAKSANLFAKRGTADEEPDREVGQHQQMRYQVETFAAGTQFFVEFILNDVTDVEFEAFLMCLAEFHRKPFVGGKSATGHGKVALNFEGGWQHIDPRQGLGGTEVDVPLMTRYMDHLASRGQEIRHELARFV